MIDPDLARAFDECHARLLTDAAADETDPLAAAGYAWLRDKEKWPGRMIAGVEGWGFYDNLDDFNHVGDECCLPASATALMPGDPRHYPTPSAALAAAALAIGRWLSDRRTRHL